MVGKHDTMKNQYRFTVTVTHYKHIGITDHMVPNVLFFCSQGLMSYTPQYHPPTLTKYNINS